MECENGKQYADTVTCCLNKNVNNSDQRNGLIYGFYTNWTSTMHDHIRSHFYSPHFAVALIQFVNGSSFFFLLFILNFHVDQCCDCVRVCFIFTLFRFHFIFIVWTLNTLMQSVGDNTTTEIAK